MKCKTQKCREEKCKGNVLMTIEKGIRKYKCNICDKEHFVYRKKRKNIRPQV